MKHLVVYSTLTGNTRMIAEAVFKSLPEPKEIFNIETAPQPDSYDFIAVGFWVDRGSADAKSKKYMEGIKGKKVGIFGTLGAYPNSRHAMETLENVRAMLVGNELLGEFICQGRVDPELLKRMPQDGPHAMTDERKERLAEAARHPNETDCRYAQNAFREMLKEDAQSETGLSKTGIRKMTEPEIEQTVKKLNWASICTVTPGGSPYAIEATPFFDEDKICFMINPKGTTAKNIRANPDVLIKFTQTTIGLLNWLGISCFGKGEFIQNKDALRRGWELLGSVMKTDYTKAADKFCTNPQDSPLLSIKVEQMTGRCNFKSGLQ